MIRVLLVDDSPLFCAQFQSLAHWEALGIVIQDVARNGRDAIERLSRAVPDVILTDINMPVMGGIGLIEYVRANHPQIPVIALSAYDDFDYVRDSLKRGASDYILKHQLDAGKLAELLHREVRSSEPEAGTELTRQQQIQTFFALVLSDWFDDEEAIGRRMRALGIAFPEHGGIPILAGLDHEQSAVSAAFTEPMLQLLRESLKPWFWAGARMRDDLILLILRMEREGQPGYNLADVLQASSVTMERFFGAGLSFSVGEGIRGLNVLSRQVARLREQYDAMRFLGKRQFLAIQDSSGRPAVGAMSIEDERRLAELAERGDRQGASEMLDRLFSQLQHRGYAPMDISMFYATIVNVLIRIHDRLNPDSTMEAIPTVSDFSSLREMQDWCQKQFARLIDAQSEDRPGRSAYVQQAVAYIHANYARHIPLRDIARSVGLSESYLSRLFKEEMGVNIVSYINNHRLDTAERMLRESDLPIKEIALSVGIPNYNHFFSMYRARKGCTPTAARLGDAPSKD